MFITVSWLVRQGSSDQVLHVALKDESYSNEGSLYYQAV